MCNSKIDLYLMTEKGVKVLEALINASLSKIINCIVIGKDKNVSNDYSQEIIEIANKNNIKFYFRNESFKSSEFSLAVGWRWLIDLKTTNLAIIHDSLLPKYRGFAPLVNMLIKGEPKIGATLLWADSTYDSGNIVAQKSVEIDYPIKIQYAIKLISGIYQELALLFCNMIFNDEVSSGTPQNHYDATYSLWRNDEDYLIKWSDSSKQILRVINALGSPYSGAKTRIDGKLMTIKEAEIFNDVVIENRIPGKIIFFRNGCPVVVCGSGLLKIISLVDSNNMSILPLKKFRIKFQ